MPYHCWSFYHLLMRSAWLLKRVATWSVAVLVVEMVAERLILGVCAGRKGWMVVALRVLVGHCSQVGVV